MSVKSFVCAAHLPLFLLVHLLCCYPVGKPLSDWPQAEGAGPGKPVTVSPPPTVSIQPVSSGYSEGTQQSNNNGERQQQATTIRTHTHTHILEVRTYI